MTSQNAPGAPSDPPVKVPGSAPRFPRLETCVPGLDNLTYGGLPEGRTTLIAGRSGTGKSILALQIGANLARRGYGVAYVTVEESPDDIRTTGDTLSFGMSELLESGRLVIADFFPPLDATSVTEGDYDVSGLVHRVERLKESHGIRVVVLDSATALFGPGGDLGQLRRQFFQLTSAFRALDLTFIVTAEAPSEYGDITVLGVEDFVCDAVIVVRNVVDQHRRRRSIEVHKYRRSNHFKGEFPCTITARGLTVFPLDVSGGGEVGPTERFSSGVPGLDAMISGGWLRDAIVLARGPAGGGKTILAGIYARAGASRGERVLYFGFEETRSMLLRNFATLGLDLEPYCEADRLRIHCQYPEATSTEDLLVELRIALDDFQPSLVVIDSVSAIEHSTSSLGFRQFLIGMAALLRQHGRSALLTQAIGGPSDIARTAPYLLTVSDVILSLEHHVRDDGDTERRMRVLKMRGSAHETRARPFRIAQGGIVFDEVPTKA